MSNNLDKDQARHFVGPDMGSNCLQMLSADDKSRERVSVSYYCVDPASPVIKPIKKLPFVNIIDTSVDIPVHPRSLIGAIVYNNR